MIELRHITKTYQDKTQHFNALDDINLLIEQGQIVGIVGRSGAGKSTLLRIVNLLERPTTGQVFINGVDLTSLLHEPCDLKDIALG